MNFYTDWLHGTVHTISAWTLTNRNQTKSGSPVHQAIFFTTDRQFAVLSGGGADANPNVYKANLKPGSKVLDLSDPGVSCSSEESEALRQLVASRRPGKGNFHSEDSSRWTEGWRTGAMMKLGIRPGDHQLGKMLGLISSGLKTRESVAAWNFIQQATRDAIEDVVDASRAAGYQAVAANELQYGKTFPLLIVLDPGILTSPIKV